MDTAAAVMTINEAMPDVPWEDALEGVLIDMAVSSPVAKLMRGGRLNLASVVESAIRDTIPRGMCLTTHNNPTPEEAAVNEALLGGEVFMRITVCADGHTPADIYAAATA